MSVSLSHLLLVYHGSELVGIDLAVVREILRMLMPRDLPGAPLGVLGIADVRGEMVPVLDLEARLPVGAGEPGVDHHLVVIDLPGTALAVAISHAEGVVDLAEDEFREAKGVLPEGVPLLGVARTARGLIPVLDPAVLMREGEIVTLKAAMEKLLEAMD